MIKLKEIKELPKQLEPKPISNIDKKQLQKLADNQRELGLGTPSIDRFNNLTVKEVLTNKEIDQINRLDKTVFPLIQEPKYDRASGIGTSWVSIGKNFLFNPPKVVMASLTESVHIVDCYAGRNYCQANIPLIPMSVQEMVKRFKAQAPDARLHLIFEPSWKKQPQADPVIVGEFVESKVWVKVASWDGDDDLVKELKSNSST